MKLKFTFLFIAFLSVLTISTAQTGLGFDGTNDYIQTNFTGITGSSSRTIEAWIKTGTTGAQRVIADMGTMPNGTRFTLNILNGLLRIEIGGGGINSTVSVTDNQWHHVAVTYDNSLSSSKYKLYIDGTLNTSGDITAANINTAAGVGFMIGRRNDGVNYFQGQMDEVRVWNVVRTAAQIMASMNTELCGANNLVAYYRFNEGSPNANNSAISTVTDNSGGGNTGTMNGFALSGNTSNWTNGITLTTAGGSATFGNLATSACGSYTAPSGDFTVNTSGMYMDTIANYQGCDSILTINLTINNSTSSTIAVTACNNYVAPNGDNYSTSQTLNYTIPNAAGCDSLVTLNLTILNPSSTITETACGSYTAPSGAVYTTSQVVTDIIPSFNNCDSTITINLTVVNIDTSITIISPEVATANESGAGVTYQWVDCDNNNAPVSGATGQTFFPILVGNYAVQITNGNCTAISSCVPLTIFLNTQSQILKSEVSIFPNPTLGDFMINLGQAYQDVNIEITAIDGKVVLNKQVNNATQIPVQFNAPLGVYQIKIIADNEVAYFRILKQ